VSARVAGRWPRSAAELVAEQHALAVATPPFWEFAPGLAVGACFVCFERAPRGPGHAGDRAWAAASLGDAVRVVTGQAGTPYVPGLLALREGALLAEATQALPRRADVVLVDATGRDHPRRAGLALHLGAILDVPTVGVTHRGLLAAGAWPADEPGAAAPLLLGDELVGYWVRTRRGRRPLAVHAAWRTDPETAVEVILACTHGLRTPEPLRRARTAARVARAKALYGAVNANAP
jgi:deoxyribonuclease V